MTCSISFTDKNFYFNPLPGDLFSHSDKRIDDNSMRLNVLNAGKPVQIWVDRNQIAEKLKIDANDVSSIDENPAKFIQFLRRVNGLTGKLPDVIQQVNRYYPRSRFIRKDEIEETAKKLARLIVYDPSSLNDRLSAEQYGLPVTVCSTDKKIYFNIRKSKHQAGSVRICKVSISEDREFIARVTGVIQEPLQWKNEKQALKQLNGKRGVIATYGCYEYESKKKKAKSTTLHPLFKSDLHDLIKNGCNHISPKIKEQMTGQILHALANVCEIAVHGDWKSENIVYRYNRQTDSIELALIDFGFVQFLDCLQIFEGGSADYASPERFTGRNQADPKWDVWGVGVILHLIYVDKIPHWMYLKGDQLKGEEINKLQPNWVKLPKDLDPRIAYMLPRMLHPNLKERMTPEQAWTVFHKGVPKEETKNQ